MTPSPTNAQVNARIASAKPKPSASVTRSPVYQAAYDAAYDAAYAQSAAAEQARCEAIICSPEAKGREALALHVATNSNVTVEAAVAMLALSPMSPKTDDDGAFATGFAQAVGGRGTPPKADDDGADIVALARSVGLAGFAP
jgi:hypothetical protein